MLELFIPWLQMQQCRFFKAAISQQAYWHFYGWHQGLPKVITPPCSCGIFFFLGISPPRAMVACLTQKEEFPIWLSLLCLESVFWRVLYHCNLGLKTKRYCRKTRAVEFSQICCHSFTTIQNSKKSKILAFCTLTHFTLKCSSIWMQVSFLMKGCIHACWMP